MGDNSYTKIAYIETFYPTMNLRWVEREVPVASGMVRVDKILQQMWQSILGAQEWRDIETQTENT